MTGKNTGNSRIRDNMCTAGGMTGLKITPEGDTTIVRRTSLQPQDTTIATVLHAAGYKTCLVNKWHLDGYDPKSSPIYRGFDEFHGWLISTVESNSPYYYPYNRFDNDKLIHIKANEHDKHIKHNTDISTDDAINFIKRNKKNPFFLYLAFDAPHEPYIIDNTTWYDDESWRHERHLPQNINGMNILPLFYGKQIDTDDRVLYWEFPGKQRAARHGDWKAVTIKPNKPLELYNLREDPEEKHDLAKKYPEMVIGFDKVMKEMRTPSENWPIPEDVESRKK